MASSSVNLFLFITLFCTSTSCCHGVIQLPKNTTFPAIFFFGDSTVDQGNNNVLLKTLSKCNYPPYGQDFQGGLPTGRFSNGKTLPDFFAEELGIKSLIPAYLDPNLKAQDLISGVSFGSGGSGYDSLTAKLALVFPISNQLEQFKEYTEKLIGAVGKEHANFILSNSLYLVVAGTNDLAITYFNTKIRKAQYDISSYADLLVASASSFIKELYKVGARRIAVFGVPPVGCLPIQRSLAGGLVRVCAEDQNEAARLVNVKLSTQVELLNKILPQSRVVYLDIYTPTLDIIQHPQNYGFEVSDRGCCGTGYVEVVELCNVYSATCNDRSKYVFWDSVHPTERTYKILIDFLIKKYINSLI